MSRALLAPPSVPLERIAFVLVSILVDDLHCADINSRCNKAAKTSKPSVTNVTSFPEQRNQFNTMLMRPMQPAVAVAVLVQSNLASLPDQAVAPDQARRIRNETSSVAVDLQLAKMPGQVHIGVYQQASEVLYIRDLQ